MELVIALSQISKITVLGSSNDKNQTISIITFNNVLFTISCGVKAAGV
jgi:hypothetical protein